MTGQGETKQDIGDTLILDDVQNEALPPDQDAMALVGDIQTRLAKLYIETAAIQDDLTRLIALLERRAGLLAALKEIEKLAARKTERAQVKDETRESLIGTIENIRGVAWHALTKVGTP